MPKIWGSVSAACGAGANAPADPCRAAVRTYIQAVGSNLGALNTLELELVRIVTSIPGPVLVEVGASVANAQTRATEQRERQRRAKMHPLRRFFTPPLQVLPRQLNPAFTNEEFRRENSGPIDQTEIIVTDQNGSAPLIPSGGPLTDIGGVQTIFDTGETFDEGEPVSPNYRPSRSRSERVVRLYSAARGRHPPHENGEV